MDAVPLTSDIYIGILSGTSIDAIDVALVDFTAIPFNLLGTHSEPFPAKLRQSLHDLCQAGNDEINRLGQLDRQVGSLFAMACNHLLDKVSISKNKICAIGSHGQTIRHQPNFSEPFTLQIGDPNMIAELTGIMTIADFRRRDMVCGGQGAPLTPAFHHFAFHTENANRVVVNIGGISNITFLPADPSDSVIGFDCGPGNTLLDQWVKQHLNQPFDVNGAFAKSGRLDNALLMDFLADPYFQLGPPKSTGREYFNMDWLVAKLRDRQIAPENVQSTLAELTVHGILNAIQLLSKKPVEILLCGGGANNLDLITRLKKHKGDHQLFSTADFGVDPNWVEAIAFAWLARQTCKRLPGNLPEVTGACRKAILGGIYL